MRILLLSLFMVVVASAPGTVEAGGEEPAAQSIVLDVRAQGAKAVVDRLNSGARPRPWDRVLDHVETGKREWLDAAEALLDGTDAGTSTGMHVALARALPRNPGGVLKLVVSERVSIDEVCTAPFIEPTPAFITRYLRDTRRALDRLRLPEVEPQRRACLAAVEETIEIERRLAAQAAPAR